MLRFDFKTVQESEALFNYLDTHGFNQVAAQHVDGMWDRWNIMINPENKTYYETIKTDLSFPTICKNFTEVIQRVDGTYYSKRLWKFMMDYKFYQTIGPAVLDNRRVIMGSF